jgi:GT2 family glycosyltransferase
MTPTGNHKGKTIVTVPVYMRSEEDWLLTRRTLTDLAKTVPEKNTIIVVDDASPYKEGLVNLHQFVFEQMQYENKHLYWSGYFKSKNEGFANSVNVGMRTALDNEMNCLLVNADMEFPDPDWFERMHTTAGSVIGGKLLFSNGLIQHAGIYFSIVTRTFDHLHRFGPADLLAANFERKCPVTGALQLIKYECIKEVGIYDEDFKLGWEDVDYCLRTFFSGRDCVYQPEVVAIHHESMFRGNRNDKIDEWIEKSFKQLYNKHHGKSFAKYVPMLIGQHPLAGKEQRADEHRGVQSPVAG